MVPKGTGARRPLRLRPWQVELVGSVLDPVPPPSLARWMLPRGQGKSALVLALGLDDLMLGAEGGVCGGGGRHGRAAGRMRMYEAVVDGTVTHSGDPRLARHGANATVRTDNRGTRIYKEHTHSTRRIDLAVCTIMAHSVAATIDPGLQPFWYEDVSQTG